MLLKQELFLLVDRRWLEHVKSQTAGAIVLDKRMDSSGIVSCSKEINFLTLCVAAPIESGVT